MVTIIVLAWLGSDDGLPGVSHAAQGGQGLQDRQNSQAYQGINIRGLLSVHLNCKGEYTHSILPVHLNCKGEYTHSILSVHLNC